MNYQSAEHYICKLSVKEAKRVLIEDYNAVLTEEGVYQVKGVEGLYEFFQPYPDSKNLYFEV